MLILDIYVYIEYKYALKIFIAFVPKILRTKLRANKVCAEKFQELIHWCNLQSLMLSFLFEAATIVVVQSWSF